MMDRLRKISENLLTSSTKSDNIVEILKLSESEDCEVVQCSVTCLRDVFSHLLTLTTGPGSKVYLRADDSISESSLTAEEKNAARLRQLYSTGLDRLQRLMLHENDDVQQAAAGALCELVKAETTARSRPKKRKSKALQQPQRQYQFAVYTLRRVLVSLLDTTANTAVALSSVVKFLELDDFRFSLLKTMEMIMREKSEGKSSTPCFVGNCFGILKAIAMPRMECQITSFIVDEENAASEPPRKKAKSAEGAEERRRKELYGDPASIAAHRRVFSSAWLSFLRLPLPSSVLVRVLNNIHTNVMPHMLNPKLLIDFLTDAYDAGGAVSLLALNGLFLLINKHHLDYPDFYEKLYALMQPSLFYEKHCSRFFRLANRFLSSSHLSAYLVAAFAKRLSRLSLTAPPAGCLIAVAMITNLLKRHPSCKVLVHRKTQERLLDENGEFLPAVETSVESDVYLPAEADLSKCRALDSCLWELQCLRGHYVPAVSNSLALLNSVNDVVEIDLEPYLENSYESLQEGVRSADAYLAPSIGKACTPSFTEALSRIAAEIL
ncbi:nucleolar complex protein 4 homolog [Sycon ciliatum]|uniref:nucleolar complex protein 4 homolog n=1 Tax=Sycon ciliatum TaxID=27933 RepID=UPI0031F70A2E